VPCPSDGITCTTDACSEAQQACLHTPDNSACPPGQLCVIPQGGCAVPPSCLDSAQCQNGNLCDGLEVCGVCSRASR
jgi:hypothetical protein